MAAWCFKEMKFSGLYYKPLTIVNNDSRVINKLEASHTDNERVIIYDRHMFIVPATVQYGPLGYFLIWQQRNLSGASFATSWTTWSQGSRLQSWLHLIKLLLAPINLYSLAPTSLTDHRPILAKKSKLWLGIFRQFLPMLASMDPKKL